MDESGIHTQMSRDYGYSLVGTRAYESRKIRPKKSDKLTIIAGLGINGVLATCELNGSLTGESFYTYVKDILIPELKKGQIVILDNLSCHKVSGISELFDNAGIEYKYLPPYSPDFSAIEEYWSKIKSYLKGKAERSLDGLRKVLLEAFDTVTLSDIWGWFKHAGCNIQ